MLYLPEFQVVALRLAACHNLTFNTIKAKYFWHEKKSTRPHAPRNINIPYKTLQFLVSVS